MAFGDFTSRLTDSSDLKFKALMERARSLTVGGIIEFRMCKIAAEGHGYKPEAIHGFVHMVPMGDAEIVR